MTSAELRAALRIEGTLALTADTLGSPAIGRTLAAYFPGSRLTVDPAELLSGPDDAFVLVGGTVHLLGVPLADARVRFSLAEDDQAQLEITGSPPAGWHLRDSFPSLQDDATVGELELKTPMLTLRSDGAGGGPGTVVLTAGYQTPPAWSVLQWFAAHDGTATISGPITVTDGLPDVTLVASPAIRASLGGYLSIDLTFQHLARSFPVVHRPGTTMSGGPSPPDVTAATIRRVVSTSGRLSGALSFNHNGAPVAVPITADPDNDLSVLRFELDTEDAFDLALGEIAHWVGGVDLGSGGLPASYRSPLGLRLHHVRFALGLHTRTLEYVALSVRSTTPWTVVAGAIEIAAVTLDFMVLRPATDRQVFAALSGTLAIGGVHLDVYAKVPDFQIEGGLAEESAVDLAPLIEHHLGGDHGVPVELKIDDLSFSAHPSSGDYRLRIGVDGDWAVTPGFTLSAVGLEIARIGVGAEAETSVRAHAAFALAGVGVAVSAVKEGGDAGGWLFTGEMEPGASIPISSLIVDLVKQFGVGATLPAAVSSTTVTALRVSFDTGTRAFTFFCDTQIALGSGVTPGAPGKRLDCTLAIDVKPSGESYEKTVAGTVRVGGLEFDLTFDSTATATRFLAGYEDTSGGTVNLGTLLGAVTDDQAGIDAAGSFSLALKDALLIYDHSAPAPSNDQTGANGGAGAGQTGTAVSRVVFGADIGAGIDLSGLPLVGRLFSAGSALKLAFQPVVATSAVPSAEVDALRSLIPAGGLMLPSGGLAKGLTLATRLQMGSAPVELKLPFGINQGSGQITDRSKAAPTGPGNPPPIVPAASDGVHWVALQKAFGPVQLERVGVRFADGTLGFLLDGSLSAAGLTLALDGLEADVTLADIQAHRFDPSFRLRGLGVDYSNGAVEIGGALLHLTPEETGGTDEYDGLAVLKAAGFSLSAIGSYAELAGFRSLFLYAALNTPLGGPPYFFVTGLAAGFGFNRDLKIPALNGLLDFPLISTAMQGAGADSPPTSMGGTGRKYLLDKLTKLHDYVPVVQGQYFFAVGLRVSTFKVLDTFALLTVSVGSRGAEFDLLGVMTLVLPPGAEEEGVTPLAELQLALRAAVVPDEGWAGLFGELTRNSYILSRSAKLTGGFAIVTWFDGPHAGDFVVTVGGYHPQFQVPNHYPSVPQLGLNWQVSTELSVKGGLYFALVPHAAMAGGDLEALFVADSIKAWFRAGAHFLVLWKPFHYEAALYVDMGVSYTFNSFGTHTITVDVGADLKLWGPEFSGEANVHLYVVSFTISFGAGAKPPPPLDWATFRSSFLPADQNGRQVVVGVSVRAGLLRRAQDAAGVLNVVNPKEVVLATNSLVPATTDGNGAAYAPIGIGPMALALGAVTSKQAVTVRFDGKPRNDLFCLKPVVKKAPRALWGGTLRPDLNAEGWVEGAVAGYEIRPATPPASGATHAVPRVNLAFDTERAPTVVTAAPPRAFVLSPVQGRSYLANEVDTPAMASARRALLTAFGFDPATTVAGLDTPFANDFLFAPQLGTLARAA